MTNASIKQYAEELSEILMRIEDAKVEATSIIEAAKEAGVDTKALRKVAREMVMQSDKLARKYADEEQLDMFRAQVGIFKRKGLEETDKAASSSQKALRKRANTALRELDGMLGSNIAADQEDLQRRVNKHIAGKAAE